MLARRTASGKGGPWACAEHPTDRTYGAGLCPRTEALVARSVIVPVGVGYDERDCDDVATAVRKVACRICCRERAVRGRRLRHAAQHIHLPGTAQRPASRSPCSRAGRERRRKRRATRGDPATSSTTGSDAIARDDVDAVVVATPNALHHDVAVAAATAASTCSSTSRWRARPPTPTR